jgi:hypothetical protein
MNEVQLWSNGGKAEVLGEGACSDDTLNTTDPKQTWDRTQTTVVRGRRLTATKMV